MDQLIQNKIKSIITDEEVTTHFLCVKSHSGFFGNEIADHYAKESFKKLDELKKMSKTKMSNCKGSVMKKVIKG